MGRAPSMGRALVSVGRARVDFNKFTQILLKMISLLLEGTMKLNGGRERLYSLVLN